MAASGKLNASTLERREQAAIITWVALPAAMSSRMICTPSGEQSMACCLTLAILPSRLAMVSNWPTFSRSPIPQPVQI